MIVVFKLYIFERHICFELIKKELKIYIVGDIG